MICQPSTQALFSIFEREFVKKNFLHAQVLKTIPRAIRIDCLTQRLHNTTFSSLDVGRKEHDDSSLGVCAVRIAGVVIMFDTSFNILYLQSPATHIQSAAQVIYTAQMAQYATKIPK